MIASFHDRSMGDELRQARSGTDDNGDSADERVSLYPLEFEEALAGLLAVDPHSESETKGDDNGDDS